MYAIVQSLCCASETNIISHSNYIPIFTNLKEKFYTEKNYFCGDNNSSFGGAKCYGKMFSPLMEENCTKNYTKNWCSAYIIHSHIQTNFDTLLIEKKLQLTKWTNIITYT